MKIYIIEDDVSVISVLEDIVEENNLGIICGDTDGEPADIQAVLAIDPDIVLVDVRPEECRCPRGKAGGFF